MVTSPADAAPSFFWRGGDGLWSAVENWAESAEGNTAYNPATYGIASFNTAAAASNTQVITLDADRTIQGLDFSSTGNTTIVGNVNRTLQLYESITVNAGAGDVTIGSATNGQRVAVKLNSQPNTWTNASSRTLTFQNDVQIGDWSPLTVTGSGKTVINGTLSQSLGDVALAKSGTGSLTLNGANTYKGATSITAGALVINGNQNAATGTLTVSGSGTRLAGSGTIGGNTTIVAGAIHSAGALNAVGKQTFDQAGAATTNLTYNSGSIFSWNIDRTQAQTRGIGYDAVDITGTLGKSTPGNSPGQAIFRIVIGDSGFTDAFWSSARSWSDIFTNGSAVVSNWARIFEHGGFQYYNTAGSLVSPTGTGSFSLSGNTLSWSPQAGATFVSFVPEPTGAIGGMLIGSGLLRRRRL